MRQGTDIKDECMVTKHSEDIREYIQEKLNEGQSREVLKERLMIYGHNPDLVDDIRIGAENNSHSPYFSKKIFLILIFVALLGIALFAFLLPESKSSSLPAEGSKEDVSAQLNSSDFKKPACLENWNCGEWSVCINKMQTRTCTDNTTCKSSISKPSETRSCTTCSEKWTCSLWSECKDSIQKRSCIDENACNTNISKPSEMQSCEDPKPSENCVPIIKNGESKDKLDIVFVSSRLDDSEFDQDIQNSLFNDPPQLTGQSNGDRVYLENSSKGILVIEPFKSNTKKINVWKITKKGIFKPEDIFPEVKDFVKSNCPFYDEIIVLENIDYEGYVSSRGGGGVAITTIEAVAHEFGHSFGGLYDEYLLTSENVSTSPSQGFDSSLNCDVAGCPKWKNLEGYGCYAGCFAPNVYRSADLSIMKEIHAPSYSPAAIEHLTKLMNQYN